MTILQLLFAAIIIEGYVVLSSELLAMREVISYVGSGTDVASIIIAAVLMPMAFGYYAGGRFRPGLRNGKYYSVRKTLVRNVLIAAAILLPGLSIMTIDLFFYNLVALGLHDRILSVSLYALIFLVVPVFLLAQTIPLISNYFSSQRLSAITGKMLLFSTIGSFMGAVLSTLVLMTHLGVHHTVSINFVLLFILVLLMSRKKAYDQKLVMGLIMFAALWMNSSSMMKDAGILANNAYNTVSVVSTESPNGLRHLLINNSYSSGINENGSKYEYIEYMEKHFLYSRMAGGNAPKMSVLVIGTGGFTFGLEDTFNDYTYVDIDKELKEIAERDFLQENLTKNKTFVPQDARAFLAYTKDKYDLVILDTYAGRETIPEYLLTADYFQQVKKVMKPNAIMLANIIASPVLDGPFSQNVDNTFRAVFPHVTRQIVSDSYDGWDDAESRMVNLVYIYRNRGEQFNDVYTDNLNRSFLDKPKRQ